MSNFIYKPLADGVYEHKGSIISVGSGDNLAISEKKPRMKIWVGELPANWRLCKGTEETQPAEPPMPESTRDAIHDALTAAIALLSGDDQARFIEAREWLTGQPDARRFLKKLENADGNAPTNL